MQQSIQPELVAVLDVLTNRYINLFSNKMINKLPEEIEILGAKLSEKNFPTCYQWAKQRPDTLKESVEGIMEAEEWNDPNLALNILDLDLSHMTKKQRDLWIKSDRYKNTTNPSLIKELSVNDNAQFL